MSKEMRPLEWLINYIDVIEKADASCEQKLILPELKVVRNLLCVYTEKRPLLEIPEELQVSDFVSEFIEKLIEQLEADNKRWGNTWLKRPKEGQELRTKDRYTDYFDMFENAGTPVPWMKIVGGALICWIRENHPELCIDANECEDEGKPTFGKVTPPAGHPYLRDISEEPKIETTELEEAIAGEAEKAAEYMSAENFENRGLSELKRPLVGLGVKREEKAVEDMTTKELVESPSPEPNHGTFEVELGNNVQHKSDCAVHNEPAMPAGECDCQDSEPAVEHEPGCASFNDPPAGFASSASECDCQGKD